MKGTLYRVAIVRNVPSENTEGTAPLSELIAESTVIAMNETTAAAMAVRGLNPDVVFDGNCETIVRPF